MPPGCGRRACAVRRMPVTSQGWRPTSVTIQPESVATQPEKVSAGESPQQPLRRRAALRACNQAPVQASASISTPIAEHDAKGEEQRRHRRRIRRKRVDAFHLAVRMVREDQARALGHLDGEIVVPRLLRWARRTAPAARRARYSTAPPSPRSSPAGARAYSARAGRPRRSAAARSPRRPARRCAACAAPRHRRERAAGARPTARRCTKDAVSPEASIMWVKR